MFGFYSLLLQLYTFTFCYSELFKCSLLYLDLSQPEDTFPCHEFIMNKIKFCRVSELRSCVKIEVAILNPPSVIVFLVSVDVKKH